MASVKFCGIVLSLAAALAAQTPADFDAIVQQADAARDSQRFNEAAALYQQALRKRPDWKQGWWILGSILYDGDRYSEAKEAFLPLTKLDSDKSAGWAMAGLCEFELEQYADAITHLQTAERLGLPDSLFDTVTYHAALSMVRIGEFDEAIEFISHYAARGFSSPHLEEAMGIAGLRQNLLPKQVPKADYPLVLGLGKAMSDAAATHVKEATAEFQALVTAYPNRPQLHYLFGLVLLLSNPDQAISEFQRELKISPGHAQALVSLAAEYLKSENYAGALAAAEEDVKAHPDYFPAHAILGKTLVNGGLDQAKGIAELEEAVRMSPGDPQSRLALASAYSKAGRKNDAAAQRSEFLRLRSQLDAAAGQK